MTQTRKSAPARSEESRENILRAAGAMFARKGYENSSLDEIAREAGFTKGAVYYFFRSKEALLISLLDRIEARSIGRTAAALAQNDGSLRQKLMIFIGLQAEWAAEHPEDLAILMRASIDTVGDTSPAGRRVAAIYELMSRTLETLMTHSDAEVRAAAGVSIPDMVVSLMALHDGNMLLWYRGGCDPETGRRLVSASRRAMLFTVGLTR